MRIFLVKTWNVSRETYESVRNTDVKDSHNVATVYEMVIILLRLCTGACITQQRRQLTVKPKFHYADLMGISRESRACHGEVADVNHS